MTHACGAALVTGVLAAQHLQEWQAGAQQVLYPGLRQPVLHWGAARSSSIANSSSGSIGDGKIEGVQDITDSSSSDRSSSSSSSSRPPGGFIEDTGLQQSCRVSQLEASR
jgi:hypothetical protein